MPFYLHVRATPLFPAFMSAVRSSNNFFNVQQQFTGDKTMFCTYIKALKSDKSFLVAHHCNAEAESLFGTQRFQD